MSARCSAKPVSTPGMSLSESQRDACRTTGTSKGGGGPVSARSAVRWTCPDEPSRRENVAGVACVPPSSRPTWASVWRTSAAPISSFFAEKGLIEGGITNTRPGSIQGGGNCSLENTKARHVVEVAAQELPRPQGVLVLGVEPDVAAPHHGDARLAQQRCHAGRLGVVEEHHVVGAQPREQLDRVGPEVAS